MAIGGGAVRTAGNWPTDTIPANVTELAAKQPIKPTQTRRRNFRSRRFCKVARRLKNRSGWLVDLIGWFDRAGGCRRLVELLADLGQFDGQGGIRYFAALSYTAHFLQDFRERPTGGK